ncbi:hypothetical protein FB570_101189 [Streptomyces sp. T12]|nr:hypothetical protein FB570_101189 [Streptomyces sp. T12]
MRCAYVARPLSPADDFDLHAESLEALADQLADGTACPADGSVGRPR